MAPTWRRVRAVLLMACLVVLPAVGWRGLAATAEARADRRAAAAYAQGVALQMERRYAEAALVFQDAIRTSPRATAAYEGLAEVEFRQGRIGEAVAAYRTLIARYPYTYLAEPHRQVGLIELRAGLFGEAARDLRQAVTLDPSDWLAFYWLGHAQARLGDTAAARAAWERVTQLNPDFSPVRDQLRKLDARRR